MALEHFDIYKKSPEANARALEAQGAKPFDIMANQVPESAILIFMQDQQLIKMIEQANWPTDEEGCEAIAEKRGMGAEQIAAISKYHRGVEAEARKEMMH